MVPAHPTQWAVESKSVKAPDFDPRSGQIVEESPRAVAQGADPIVEDPHPNPFAGLSRQQIGEESSGLVFIDYVALEMNPLLSGLDGINPGRIVGLCIFQQLHAIP